MTPPLQHQISFRQSLYAVMVCLLLGIILASIRIGEEYRQERLASQVKLNDLVQTIRESATQAAFSMDESLAAKLVEGLSREPTINTVEIRDALGTVLARREHAATQHPTGYLAGILADQPQVLIFPLANRQLQKNVGTLAITTSTESLTDRFIARAARVFVIDLLQYLVLAGVLFTLFYYSLTKPVIDMANHYVRIDLEAPENGVMTIPKKIARNELGYLAATINQLLRQFSTTLHSRNHIEKKLQAGEKRYREIFENIQDVYYEITMDGHLLEISPSVENIIGISREQLLGRNVTDFYVNPEERTIMVEMLLQSKPVTDYEVLLRDESGLMRYGSICASLVRGPQQEPEKIIGSIRDITNRKYAELQLQKYQENLEELVGQRTRELAGSELRYRAVVESQTELICRFRPGGNLSFANQVCSAFFRFPPEVSPTMMNFFSFFPDTTRKQIREKIQRLEEHQSLFKFEQVVEYDNNHSQWLEWNVQALYDSEGTCTEYQAVGRDVTERKQYEEARRFYEQQLQQAQKREAVAVLADGIAHNFNNFLQGIGGYLGLLSMRKKEGDPDLETLNKVSEIVENAKHQVLQLLAMSEQKKQVDPEFIDLNQAVQHLIPSIQQALPPSITWEFDLAADEAIINFPTRHLERIVHNLCTNASEATRGNGRILITTRTSPCRSEDSYHALQVRDWGPGMTRDTVASIYDPFFTTKTIGEGAGLGLSVTYGLLKQYQAKIVCDSQPAKGTRFDIYFPAQHPKTAASSAAETAQAGLVGS